MKLELHVIYNWLNKLKSSHPVFFLQGVLLSLRSKMLPFYFAYYSSPLGSIRIKSTESSIYELIFVGESQENDIHQPYIMQSCLRQLDEYFNGIRKQFDIPVNPDGTTFQCSVWENLNTIPYGSTQSYENLAKLSGGIHHIRAVANANAKNPVAILQPCHRVIGKGGDLKGYAWGLERKKWLLDFEARNSGTYMKLF